jgi:ribose/xylose/arabinose/galactoside ABC-type transport system permease subunit
MTTESTGSTPDVARPGSSPDELARERTAWTRRRRLNLQVLGVYAALLVLCMVLTVLSPYFFTVQNVLNLFIAASNLALIGAGLTVVLIAGEIDLSIGAMEAFIGSLAAILIINVGLPWPIGVICALAGGIFCGVVSGLVTVLARLPSFITTLAMMGILQGVAYLLTNGEPVAGFPNGYQVIGVGTAGPFPLSLAIVAVCYVALHVMLHHTPLGLKIHAVGGNRAAAIAVGIHWRRVVVFVLALSAFMASISGIVITARLNAGSGSYGAEDLLPAVAAVIIGGTSLTGGVGSLAGTFGGVMIVVTINDGLTLLNVSQFWQQVAVGLIIMAAVLIDQGARGYLRSRKPGQVFPVPGLTRKVVAN